MKPPERGDDSNESENALVKANVVGFSLRNGEMSRGND
jgi:hypothetical protein